MKLLKINAEKEYDFFSSKIENEMKMKGLSPEGLQFYEMLAFHVENNKSKQTDNNEYQVHAEQQTEQQNKNIPLSSPPQENQPTFTENEVNMLLAYEEVSNQLIRKLRIV